MKFVSAKRIVDHAQRLSEVKKQRAQVAAQLHALKEEQESLEAFLLPKSPEGMMFVGADEYYQVLEWKPRERIILDNEAIERDYKRMKKPVPVRTVEWTASKVRHATEDEVA